MSNMNNILVFLAEGFEEVEALAIIDVLRRGNQPVTTVSITGSLAVRGAHDVTIQADMLLEELHSGALPKAIALPGGMTKLNECEPLLELIRRQHEAGGTIAAICASPRVLGAAGIGDGKMRATCYPGIEEQVPGFVLTGADVEVCGHIVTGRGPALALPFAFRLLEEVAGRQTAEQVAEGFLYKL